MLQMPLIEEKPIRTLYLVGMQLLPKQVQECKLVKITTAVFFRLANPKRNVFASHCNQVHYRSSSSSEPILHKIIIALCSKNFQNVKLRPTIQESIYHLNLHEINFGKI